MKRRKYRMKYLKYFSTESEYTVYKDSSKFILPNVSLVKETKNIFYESKAVAPYGTSIYGLDGKFYSLEEWTATEKSSSDAVGVAVSDGEHSFVIHPTAEQINIKWSNSAIINIAGIVTTNDNITAEMDFAGESNTLAILDAVSTGLIEDAPAAQYCIETTFANGKSGYLISLGELVLIHSYINDVNLLLGAINGKLFDMENNKYWSSTKVDDTGAWGWYYLFDSTVGFNCNADCNVRVITSL